MKIKTSELKDQALDWAVSEAEGVSYADYMEDGPINQRKWSTDWAQAGPIIERERISIGPYGDEFWAQSSATIDTYYGPTPLVAAMRAFVASRLGDEIEIPEELI